MPVSNVLSNTTPLFYLHQLGLIELLPGLFERILVAEAVVAELEEGRKLGHSVPDVSALAWAEIRAVPPNPRLTELRLGAGEVQVLSLGLELQDVLLLLDDDDARQTASRLGLAVAGTGGLIVLAKTRGLVDSVAPWLDRLRQTRFRMSETLYRTLLEQAGEL